MIPGHQPVNQRLTRWMNDGGWWIWQLHKDKDILYYSSEIEIVQILPHTFFFYYIRFIRPRQIFASGFILRNNQWWILEPSERPYNGAPPHPLCEHIPLHSHCSRGYSYSHPPKIFIRFYQIPPVTRLTIQFVSVWTWCANTLRRATGRQGCAPAIFK